jgi:signal transduction histidine kinase
MAEMIRNLQDFYRPSEGVYTPTNIDVLVNEVLSVIGKAIKSKGVLVVKYFTDNLPAIDLIEDQLKQVIMNLLQNSVEAITESGGEIVISTKQVSSGIALMIQDDGDGIAEDNLKNVFDPFFTTKGVKGTGLGLSVSYGIIKHHGGEIAVESKIGEGSTFTISLPIKRHQK